MYTTPTVMNPASNRSVRGISVLLAIGMSAAQAPSSPQPPHSGRVELYAGVGADLTQYDLDIENATLMKRRSITLPGNIQYAWPHPSRKYLYVTWGDAAQAQQGVSALSIERTSGAVHSVGQPVSPVLGATWMWLLIQLIRGELQLVNRRERTISSKVPCRFLKSLSGAMKTI